MSMRDETTHQTPPPRQRALMGNRRAGASGLRAGIGVTGPVHPGAPRSARRIRRESIPPSETMREGARGQDQRGRMNRAEDFHQHIPPARALAHPVPFPSPPTPHTHTVSRPPRERLVRREEGRGLWWGGRNGERGGEPAATGRWLARGDPGVGADARALVVGRRSSLTAGPEDEASREGTRPACHIYGHCWEGGERGSGCFLEDVCTRTQNIRTPLFCEDYAYGFLTGSGARAPE
jgi:hypothetical protein